MSLEFNLTYWVFHTQNFNLSFSEFLSLYFITCTFFLISFSYLFVVFLELIQVITLVFFHFIDYSYDHSFEFFVWNFIHFAIRITIELLAFRSEVSRWLIVFSYFLYYCFRIWASRTIYWVEFIYCFKFFQLNFFQV
jgi:hypothetical protein